MHSSKTPPKVGCINNTPVHKFAAMTRQCQQPDCGNENVFKHPNVEHSLMLPGDSLAYALQQMTSCKRLFSQLPDKLSPCSQTVLFYSSLLLQVIYEEAVCVSFVSLRV